MKQYRLMVKGIVVSQDKFLVLKSWRDDRISENPYEWVFVDGKLEYPEGPDQGMLRLIKEQTGIDAVIEKTLYTWTFMSGDICNVGISYFCRAVSDEVILSEDFVDYKWIEAEEIAGYIVNEMVLEDLRVAEIIS